MVQICSHNDFGHYLYVPVISFSAKCDVLWIVWFAVYCAFSAVQQLTQPLTAFVVVVISGVMLSGDGWNAGIAGVICANCRISNCIVHSIFTFDVCLNELNLASPFIGS